MLTAAATPRKRPSLGKRLHTRMLGLLTRSSATNVDMTLFRYLFEGRVEAQQQRQQQQPGDEKDEDAAAHAPARVLRALAPWRALHVAAPWQRDLARKLIEHPRLGAPGVVHFVVARTRWFDGQVAAAIGTGGGDKSGGGGAPRQVVALAAGYEMRAHRLAASGAAGGVTFFEVDLPHASAQKRELVAKLGLAGPPPRPSPSPPPAPSPSSSSSSPAPPARVVYVPADLSWPGALRQKLVAAGFDPSGPSVFTAEGLLYYLPEPAAAALLAEVAGLMAEADGAASAAAAAAAAVDAGDDGAAAAAAAAAPPRVAAGGGASRLVLDYLHADALAAGLARGIGGAKAAGGAGGEKQQQPPPKRKGGGRTAKRAAAAAARAGAGAAPRMPRAYEVTARSVASKGEPFVSGAGARPLEAAAWLSAATGGLLSLRAHRGTQEAADEVLPASCRGAPVLPFYSFLAAEVASAAPPTGATLAGGADAIARLP